MARQNRTSYLSQIKFDPKLKNTWWAKYLVNYRILFLIILAIVAAGVFSYSVVPRRVNPEVKIPIVIVSTVLPGASAADVETLITIPIEDKLDKVEGIDTTTSVSRDNVSVTTMQFLSSVDGNKALQDVQREIDSGDPLTEDAQEPQVTLLDFENSPIWTFTLTTAKDNASLMRFAGELRDDLEDLDEIDSVQLSGLDNQEIQVIVDPQKIAAFDINPAQLSQIVKRAVASYPAGNVQSDGLTFSLSIDRELIDIEDIRNLNLSADGRQFRLGDVAEVIRRSKTNIPKTYLVDDKSAKQAVQFYVFKAKDTNIDTAEKAAVELVDSKISVYEGQFEVKTITNVANEIIKQFDKLFNEFGLTVLLVFVLLVIFLGIRQSMIALLTIPLTLLSAMIVINLLGLSLNFLTAFAFLIALGLLIDDTIVAVAAMTRYYLTGKFTPEETAMLVWRDFIVPLWSTSITVVWAFVPLLLAGGIIGEFIKSIPIIVTASVLSSTAIAVFITLPVMAILLKPQIPYRVKVLLKLLLLLSIVLSVIFFIPRSDIYPLALILAFSALFIIYLVRRNLIDRLKSVIPLQKNKRLKSIQNGLKNGFINIERLSEIYKNIINKILLSPVLRRNTIIAVIIFSIVGYLLVPLGLVKNEFFPKTDEDVLYLQVDLPSGTSLEQTNKEMLAFAEKIKFSGDINYFSADTGAGLSQNGDRSDEPASFLLTFNLRPEEERDLTASEIAEKLRTQFNNYTKGTVRVIELSGGPPVGSDIQINLLGDDLTVLSSNAENLKNWLSKQQGITNVQVSQKAGTSKIVFVPDKQKLSDNNLTVESLGLWLRTYASGFNLDSFKIDDKDTDITFLLDPESPKIDSLGTVMVPAQNGNVPLLSLGTLELANNPINIVRENGSRRISVTAGVTAGNSATEINSKVTKYVESLGLPQGYRWESGGVNEENERSVQSIIQAMLLSFLLILITMVIEFRSFRQTAIALLVIPLGIIGVFYVFALTGTPLSFPALIGVLALFGILVRNAIIIIEKINENRRFGMSLHDSLVEASGSRLEPVLLTALSTIAGLIPITISDPLWRGLGGAIIAGLIFSGAIMLFFVPVIYYEWFKKDRK